MPAHNADSHTGIAHVVTCCAGNSSGLEKEELLVGEEKKHPAFGKEKMKRIKKKPMFTDHQTKRWPSDDHMPAQRLRIDFLLDFDKQTELRSQQDWQKALRSLCYLYPKTQRMEKLASSLRERAPRADFGNCNSSFTMVNIAISDAETIADCWETAKAFNKIELFYMVFHFFPHNGALCFFCATMSAGEAGERSGFGGIPAHRPKTLADVRLATPSPHCHPFQ